MPYSTARSINLAYSAFLDAARIREGLVVASCGLYFSIAGRFVSECRTRTEDALLTGKVTGVANDNLENKQVNSESNRRAGMSEMTYGASGLELVER